MAQTLLSGVPGPAQAGLQISGRTGPFAGGIGSLLEDGCNAQTLISSTASLFHSGSQCIYNRFITYLSPGLFAEAFQASATPRDMPMKKEPKRGPVAPPSVPMTAQATSLSNFLIRPV